MTGLGPAIRRLTVYATFEGEHLFPLHEAYEGQNLTVAEAHARFKADIVTLIRAFAEQTFDAVTARRL